MIRIIDGNLLDAQVDIIAHQVNCIENFNSGVAKAIRDYNEEVYQDYLLYCYLTEKYCAHGVSDLLGDIRICYLDNERFCVSMFAQLSEKQYTDLDAFAECLCRIKAQLPPITKENGIERQTSIAFPYKIGCVRGGADWDEVYQLIEDILGDDYDIQLWRLDCG